MWSGRRASLPAANRQTIAGERRLIHPRGAPGAWPCGVSRICPGVSRLRLVAIAGLAWSGMVLGHLLAYRVVYPEAHHRVGHLVETGHGVLPLWAICAMACAPAVLMTWAAVLLTGRGSGAPAALWLAAIQLPSFGLMELAERGFALDELLSDPAFLVGLALQAGIALLASALFLAVTRAIRLLVERGWRRSAVPRVLHAPGARSRHTRRAPFLSSLRLRAPPILAAR